MRVKKIVLIRHAHRDVTDRSLDNGLSEKGHKQVQSLIQFTERDRASLFKNAKSIEWFSSPKIRCVHTLTPLARHWGQRIEIEKRVDEQGAFEESREMKKRIQKMIEQWTLSESDLIIVCSHGDWIPLAIELWTGSSVSLKKCGWAEIGQDGNQMILVDLIQRP